VFHGDAGPQSVGTLAVTAVETYLRCPFKYLAAHVLRLPERAGADDRLTPLERGRLVHDVLRTFFEQWAAEGGGAITVDNIADARDRFVRVVDERLPSLPEAERPLERARLVGSAVATGMVDRVLELEAVDPGRVIERLLEHPLDGRLTLGAGTALRTVSLRAKADRIDLHEDGTFRVIEYKLGRAPKRAVAVQLPLYARAAAARLAGYGGRVWTPGDAGYVAFKEPRSFVPFEPRPSRRAAADADAIERFLGAVDGIEGGRFPPRPDERFLCAWCAYPAICRKDYVDEP
jgi:RecB family exonuclease